MPTAETTKKTTRVAKKKDETTKTVEPKKAEVEGVVSEVVEEAPKPRTAVVGGDGERYTAVGRRKTAIARVLLTMTGKKITINGKDLKDYFPLAELHQIVEAPLVLVNMLNSSVAVKISGGGIKSQAEAIRHGIARCLVEYNPELKKSLRGEGYITRDSRVKERKKPGLKRARKGSQWAKR